MFRNQKVVVGFVVVILVAVAAWLFNLVLGKPEEASAPISSIPLEMADDPTTVSPTGEPEPDITAVPTQPQIAPTATDEPTPSPEPTEAPPAGPVIFEISQTESAVHFILDEVLRGEPTTVIGSSDQVAGQIAVDFSDLSTVQLGIIRVNARTLATDNNFRNRAIRNVILETDAYEFITFSPTAIQGLPETAVIDEPVNFQIVGDLTIRDLTNELIFEASVTIVSDTRLEGTAVAIVQRSAYDLAIPEVEGVADVDDDVRLEITFVAEIIE